MRRLDDIAKARAMAADEYHGKVKLEKEGLVGGFTDLWPTELAYVDANYHSYIHIVQRDRVQSKYTKHWRTHRYQGDI